MTHAHTFNVNDIVYDVCDCQLSYDVCNAFRVTHVDATNVVYIDTRDATHEHTMRVDIAQHELRRFDANDVDDIDAIRARIEHDDNNDDDA